MTRGKRVAVIIVGIIVVVLAGGILYVRSIATRALPDYDSDVTLERIKDEVVVYRDAYAVPHIFAKNEGDLCRAVGYCMAQDRLWQMDLMRRACTGRLSEIFGETLVETDLLMRALRLPEKSKLMLSRCEPEVVSALEAFSDGVNQYIAMQENNLPPEFLVLGYTPEKWAPEDSLHLVGYMAWDLCLPWKHKIVLARILETFGEDMYRDVSLDISTQKSFVIPGSEMQLSELDVVFELAERFRTLEELGLTVFRGSNNWVVSGAKSTTGKPIFANDMHLTIFAPGIWYQMHQVVEGKANVTGVMLPGTPSIVAGHNEYIAWGNTNVSVDDLDFYLEKINPDNPNQYEFNGEWRDMEVRTEKINVKGGTVVEKELRFTHRGPIVPNFQNPDGRTISMRWIGNEYSNEARSLYLLSHAKNWDDFKDAMSTFSSVSQNVAYADVDGNIGIHVCAGVPIRKAGDGTAIVPGWTDEYDWTGFVPFEELPHSYNPESGFVSSANNKTADENYPYYISQLYALPHRIDRIREMLQEKEKLSVADIKRMHADHKSKRVEQIKDDIIAEMRKMEDVTALEEQSLDLLASWDNVLSKNSPAASIVQKFLTCFQKNVFFDEMGEELYDDFLSAFRLPAYGVDNIFRKKESPWCDDITTEGRKETFTDMVHKSFREAVAGLAGDFGGNPEHWEYGRMHKLHIEHPMGRVTLLDRLFKFNRGPFEVGGSHYTVCPFYGRGDNPEKVVFGASHRHIYSTANWDDSLSVIPTGTSGIPASPHYCDQTGMFLDNEYHSDYMDRELIEKNAKYKMVIRGR
jgi:penicillin amidase